MRRVVTQGSALKQLNPPPPPTKSWLHHRIHLYVGTYMYCTSLVDAYLVLLYLVSRIIASSPRKECISLLFVDLRPIMSEISLGFVNTISAKAYHPKPAQRKLQGEFGEAGYTLIRLILLVSYSQGTKYKPTERP